MQSLIVALLILGCTFYAVWTLMPGSARRALAVSMLRLPHLPHPLEATLNKSAQAGSGCGCDGCDHSDKKRAAAAPGPQPITFHRRTRR